MDDNSLIYAWIFIVLYWTLLLCYRCVCFADDDHDKNQANESGPTASDEASSTTTTTGTQSPSIEHAKSQEERAESPKKCDEANSSSPDPITWAQMMPNELDEPAEWHHGKVHMQRDAQGRVCVVTLPACRRCQGLKGAEDREHESTGEVCVV